MLASICELVLLADSHQLVLYLLKDAIEQLPDDVGMQVHRLHWVAFAYIRAC